MDFMWMVSDIARDLNMLNMAEYFGKKISETYPENHAGPRNLIRTSQARGDFETTKKIVNELIETYGERTIEFFVIDLLAYHYERGEYQEGIDLLKRRFPEFLDEPGKEIINDDQRTAAIFHLTLADKAGKTVEVEMIANRICNYKDKRLAEMEESGHIEIYNELDVKLWCQIATEQYDEAVAAMEKFYFELNSKANYPLIITSEIPFFRIKESQNFEEFEKKIYADLGIMRENVVQFLKEKDEWKEEWEEGN